MRPAIYMASRASVPARPNMWNYLRDAEFWPIISTWHNPENLQPGDLSNLWVNIEREVSRCSDLILYVEPNDLPLKGAYVEVGIALAMRKRVFVIYTGPSTLIRQHLGSWVFHPNVFVCDQLQTAYNIIKS